MRRGGSRNHRVSNCQFPPRGYPGRGDASPLKGFLFAEWGNGQTENLGQKAFERRCRIVFNSLRDLSQRRGADTSILGGEPPQEILDARVWVQFCALTQHVCVQHEYHRSMRLTLPAADLIVRFSPFVP